MQDTMKQQQRHHDIAIIPSVTGMFSQQGCSLMEPSCQYSADVVHLLNADRTVDLLLLLFLSAFEHFKVKFAVTINIVRQQASVSFTISPQFIKYSFMPVN